VGSNSGFGIQRSEASCSWAKIMVSRVIDSRIFSYDTVLMPRPKRTDEANCVYLQIKDSCHLCYAPDTASVHGEIATSGRRYHPFETVLASAIPNPESDPWRSLATGLTLSMTGQLALIYPNVWANYGNANALINAYYVD